MCVSDRGAAIGLLLLLPFVSSAGAVALCCFHVHELFGLATTFCSCFRCTTRVLKVENFLSVKANAARKDAIWMPHVCLFELLFELFGCFVCLFGLLKLFKLLFELLFELSFKLLFGLLKLC